MHNTDNKPWLLLKVNVCPHDYALKLSDMEVIKKADLLIWNGENLECFLTKLLKQPGLAKKLLTVQSLPKINKLSFRNSKQLDPHLWLSPQNAKIILEAITEKLIEMDPENIKQYLLNKQYFFSQLSNKDIYIKNKLSKIKQQNYLVFHDAYQYFERFYGLQPSLVISDHQEIPLNIQQMLAIDNLISKSKTVCLFKEPDFNPKILKNLLKTHKNLQIGDLDPIGLKQDLGKDGYFKLLTNLADGLDSCLGN